jgi:hypothetical protein
VAASLPTPIASGPPNSSNGAACSVMPPADPDQVLTRALPCTPPDVEPTATTAVPAPVPVPQATEASSWVGP